jgi:hypothetical protein
MMRLAVTPPGVLATLSGMNIKPPLPPILPSADVLRYSLIDAASNFKSVRAGN